VTGDAERLTRALELREIAIERRINVARLVVILVAGVADGLLALRHEAHGLAIGIFAGALAFLAWVVAVYRLTSGETYRPWLKYVVVAVDVMLILTVYFAYQGSPMAAHNEEFAITSVATLVVANVACGLRVGERVLVWSTVVTMAGILSIAAHLGMNAGSLSYIIMLDIVAGLLAWWISGGTQELFVTLRRRDALARFVPVDVIDRLDKGDIELVPGGEARDVTLLMSDIRGFTTLSEERKPMEVVELLNEYFAEMTRVIFDNGGSIDKFIGDAILAVWGVPEAQPDDAERAVRAALQMQEALTRLNERLEARGHPRLRIGVGVHSGVVVSGQIGAPDRMDFTVIGDAVNVASRIEGLTKEYEQPVLISEATFDRVKGRRAADKVADAEIRGRQGHIQLFCPVGRRRGADTRGQRSGPTCLGALRYCVLLVIDVGNSNTVIGLFEGEELVHHFRVSTRRHATADEYGTQLLSLLTTHGIQPDTVEGGIVSSVVPQLNRAFEHACERYFGAKPLLVGPGVKTGMPILIDNPAEVGADRIVNSVAAWHRHQQAVIVVDFGTATNFDAVSAKGEYLGGAIAPGVDISIDALFSRAAKLPRIELKRPPKAVGKNTVGALQSGLFFGYVGLVDELVGRMKQEVADDARVLATGGLARLFAEACNTLSEVDEHLTLDGLRILHDMNAPVENTK
jgi:type III pantothenate kinase